MLVGGEDADFDNVENNDDGTDDYPDPPMMTPTDQYWPGGELNPIDPEKES